MTNTKIKEHVQKFSEVVERVLENSGSLHSNDATDTILEATAFASKEIDQLRMDLGYPSKKFLEHQIVENDFFAIKKYLMVNSLLTFSNQEVHCNQSGRIVKLRHWGGRVDSLAPLELLSGLESLVFRDIPLEDFSLLSKLPSLKHLSILDNPSLDATTLRAMASLEHFEGSSCRIDDLGWVSSCPQLKTLALPGSGVKSIAQLSTSNSLVSLDLSWTPLESISALAGNATIETLSLQYAKIKDLSPLLTLPSLREVRISEELARLATFAECQAHLSAKGGKVIWIGN